MLTVFTCLDLHFDSMGHHHENIEDCCISCNEDEEVTKFISSFIILTLSFFGQVQALELILKLALISLNPLHLSPLHPGVVCSRP